MPVALDDFIEQKECIYKDDHYCVRNNGAIMRSARDGKRVRKNDSQWTFGKPNDKTGYMEMSSEGVHRIIATAFHGPAPSKDHVADHIDTNKRNNRPENLRWVTRLENILLNPITAKRIALVCGSVEAFLADPSKYRSRFRDPNIKWMQTVSVEQAKACRDNLIAWALSDNHAVAGKPVDEWIFWERRGSFIAPAQPKPTPSATANAIQKEWQHPTEFPFCPQEPQDWPLYAYRQKLVHGKVFSLNEHVTTTVYDFALSDDRNVLWILTKSAKENPVKTWLLLQVTYENEMFVHTSLGTYLDQDGAEKQFAIARGIE
ncbi:HNH endonuclease signature motif containing protein [Chitinophaga agri]|uniref:HNH endonuclease n=1 Tax=Chitinophaga agri TaxID=2703787 RepID=A0A6B9Z983_9BACT|nr:HNH endonuclease signature motif containing protein [Chitinophaga agri]QHS58810.1 HNH endonuclease [Chitinophaga agri]